MFNDCGIDCNNCAATTNSNIVRRTARCHSRDTKISSYQTKSVQRNFDDNFYYFLFHGAKIKKGFEINKFVNIL